MPRKKSWYSGEGWGRRFPAHRALWVTAKSSHLDLDVQQPKIPWFRGDAMKNLFLRSAVLVAIGANVAAHAADMPVKAPITPAPIEHWTFSLTPYFWAPSLNGSTTVKGRTADVDVGFFKILDHTQFPKGLFELAALGEARYGRFGLLTDIVYLKLGLGQSIARSRGTDEIGGAVSASAGLKVEMVIAQMAAAYEIARWSTSPQAPRLIYMPAAAPGGNVRMRKSSHPARRTSST
jgi:hypothetical protein